MIKSINKKWVSSIVLISCWLLSGCWDYSDVEKRSIIISIGVDQVNDLIEFSGEIANLTTKTAEQKQEAKTANVYTDLSYGKTFEDARNDFNTRRPYPAFLGATRVVVFGSNFAREGIEPYLNRINNLYDYRKTLLTVISREPPKELFDLRIIKDISVGFLIENNINFLANDGYTIYPTVGDILSDIAMGKLGYVLPYIGIEQDSAKYLGLAIMKDSKLIDTLDITQSQGLLYIRAENIRLIETIPNPKNKENTNAFCVKVHSRKITPGYIDNRVTFNIYLDLKAQLQYQYYREPITQAEIKQMEYLLANKIKNYIQDIITIAQIQYQCDIFSFARYFRADYPELYEKLDWCEKFSEANIITDIKVRIVNQNLSDPNAQKKY